LVLQRQQIDELSGRAEAAMLAARQARGRTLAALERRLWAGDPRLALREGRARLDGLAARAQAALRGRLAAASKALGAASAALDGMSPLRVLERGYAVVRTPEGHVVSSVESVAPGDPLDVRVRDGTIGVVVGVVVR